MTFCLGMRVREGLVAIADTRVTTGSEVITARKVTVYRQDGGAYFVMSSGLRGVRDKALTYFDEQIEHEDDPHSRLFKVANDLGQQIRRVAREDKQTLAESGLSFNIHCLVGGQLGGDQEPKLYQIYPEGNWVEIGQGTPYHIIGAATYGKPVLDRTLTFEDTIRYALKVGCLAFDSTRISAADVDFPMDVVIYDARTRQMREHRYHWDDIRHAFEWWQEQLRSNVRELPNEWMTPLLGQAAMAPPPPAGKDELNLASAPPAARQQAANQSSDDQQPPTHQSTG